MKHIAAYALLVLGGNPAPSAEDVEKLLKECGATCDKENVALAVKNIGGRPLNEVMTEGLKKMNNTVSVTAVESTEKAALKQEVVVDSDDDPVDGLGEGGFNLFDDEDY